MPLPSPSVLVLPGHRPWRSACAVPVWDLTLVAGVRQTGDDRPVEAVALALDTPEGEPRPLLTQAGGEAVVVVPLDDGRAVLQVTDGNGQRCLYAVDPDASEAPSRPLTRLLIEEDVSVTDLRLLDGHDGVVPLAWCRDGGQAEGCGRLLRLASLNGAQATAWWTTVPLPGLTLAADDVPVAVCPLAPDDLVLVVEGSRRLALWRRPAADAPWSRLGDVGGRPTSRSFLAGLEPWPPALFLAVRESSGGGGLWRLHPEEAGAPCEPLVYSDGTGTGGGQGQEQAGTVLDLASVPTPEGDAMAGLLLLTRLENGTLRLLGSTDGCTLTPVALNDALNDALNVAGGDEGDDRGAAEALALRALALAPGPIGGAPRVLLSP